jgi:hypothetical protein
MNMESITANPSPSFREHGYQFKGLEGVVEHWQRFHMRKGQCFAAPCCSKIPTLQLVDLEAGVVKESHGVAEPVPARLHELVSQSSVVLRCTSTKDVRP